MLVAGMMVFTLITFLLSFLIARPDRLDKGKVAAFVVMVAWGSLLYGLCIATIARP